MSDERLRDLERRWKETGDPQHGAALLRERVRVGDLDEGRLRLAARLGDPPALAVSGTELAGPPKIHAVVDDLLTMDFGLVPRVGHALITAVLLAEGISPLTRAVAAIVPKAIRAQLRNPSLEVDWAAIQAWEPSGGGTRTGLNIICLVASALGDPPNLERSKLELVVGSAYTNVAGEQVVCAQLAAELVPVLLQQRDPLLEIPDDLTRDQFWSLVERARASGGADGQLAALGRLLRSLAPLELVDFLTHLEEQVVRASRPELWSVCRLIMGGSADLQFAGFRLGLIALGQEWFESTLADPDSLAAYPRFNPCEGLARAVRQVLLDAKLPIWWSTPIPIVEAGSVDERDLKPTFPDLWARHEAPRVRRRKRA